ncbi:hypothetical protein [Pseudalkalibacillus decolorationis]|uniref:hypothetical protein n=1 Tax=Pseudalkalibacillus decolorationis TaxID=163879 RepID=UPI002148F9A5|nr:hypothetical protein [Pseudalkalibacillus decolorationis]
MEENQVLQAIKELQEQMNHQFSQLIGRIDKHGNRMDKLESSMGKLETRMDKLESGMGKLETRMDKLESTMDKLEEGQQVIRDHMDLFVKEHWENKADIHKIKQTIRIVQS